MDDSIRSSIKVSRETDIALRSFLTWSGMRKGDLSKFIEEAVCWRVLDRTSAAIRDRMAGIADNELQSVIDEAVAEVRRRRAVKSASNRRRRTAR